MRHPPNGTCAMRSSLCVNRRAKTAGRAWLSVLRAPWLTLPPMLSNQSTRSPGRPTIAAAPRMTTTVASADHTACHFLRSAT